MGHPDPYRTGTRIFRFASSREPAIELCILPIDLINQSILTTKRTQEWQIPFKELSWLASSTLALKVDHSASGSGIGSDLMIRSDSLASIYMMNKHVRCLNLYKSANTRELLTLIYIVKELA